MPPVAAAVAGIGSLIGGAASVAGAVASTVGAVASSVASGILGSGAALAGGAAAAVGGTISALTGAAAPVTVGQQMAAIAEPAYYEVAALGVPAATGGVAGGLSTILTGVEAGVGIYGQLAELEIAEGMSETEKIAAQTKLMEAEAAKIYAAARVPGPTPTPTPMKVLPTLSTQPVYVTPPPAAAAAPNYLLYAGLALLAFILLRKK